MGSGSSGLFHGTRGGRLKKQHGKAPRNNQKQNKQFKAVADKLKLTADERRALHDVIHDRGFDYKELLEFTKDFFDID